jgi:hypothetical protein
MKATSSKKFQKPTLGQNAKNKNTRYWQSEDDPRSLIAEIKDEEFYKFGINLPIYLMQRKFFKRRKSWYGGNKCTWSGT